MKARYKVIVDEFASAIQTGALLPGTRLPTHRALSAEKHVSLATATRVYAELEAMGLVKPEEEHLSGKFRCPQGWVWISTQWRLTCSI